MYWEIAQGKSINIQGLECKIPPDGFVFNIVTGKLEEREIYKRSEMPEEQYWERIPLPIWYKDTIKRWEAYDRKKKEDDPEFYDEQLEEYKAQEWDRRLNGFWFMNNGVPTYITGMHYLFMQWWMIDIGYPKYRVIDLEYFYFLQYVIEDPNCYGMLEVCKRRNGKTYRAGVFIYEYITRTKKTNAGIQSKTGPDAKKVFGKSVVGPFKKLPKFFRPEYDMSLGVTPKTEIRFQQTNVRGKKAEDYLERDELESLIDYQSADVMAYDGQKLHRKFDDEFAKCFAKGTRIRMYDGSAKSVEEIRNGEYVMGDDSTPRLVSGSVNGRECMYNIIPKKGEGFTCNESHILSLSVSDKFNHKGVRYKIGDVINITVKEYLELCPTYKRSLTLYRNGWELPERHHIINPYMLGMWLGDGNSGDFSITTVDKEILESINSFASEQGLYIREKEDGISYHLTSKKTGTNHVTKELRRLGVLKNKHIPQEYLIDSRENRLQLLAGLIDTDGHMMKRKNGHGGCEIVQKRKGLAEGIKELAISLGFYTHLAIQMSSMKRRDGSVYLCETYKVKIYGDIDLIPTKVERKKAIVSRTKNRRNPLKTGFRVKSVGDGEYFGFKVDRNNLFLLADGTVVHNTTECNIYERHEVTRYCLVDDEGNIIGKVLYSSTVEKLKTDKEGVQEGAKLLWDESNQLDIQENGQTKSGCYRFFMRADRSRNFDKYGEPDQEKSLKQILANREAVINNPQALSARKRKEPLTISDAFGIDADTCFFNADNIEKRTDELQKKPVPKRKIVFYRDLEQNVKWRDWQKTDGPMFWKVTPEFELNINEVVYNEVDKLKTPARAHYGAISVDGYSNSQGGRKYGSKAAAFIGYRQLLKPVGFLYGRPKIKDELHKQVMLAAEFCGFKVYYEHTADDYFGYFRDRGKIKYLGRYPMSMIDPVKIKEAQKQNKEVERFYGTPITPYSLTKQHDNGEAYFEHHIHCIDFEEVLEWAPKFDPYDRTSCDVLVSLLILISVLLEPIRKQPPPKKSLVDSYVNTNQ